MFDVNGSKLWVKHLEASAGHGRTKVISQDGEAIEVSVEDLPVSSDKRISKPSTAQLYHQNRQDMSEDQRAHW